MIHIRSIIVLIVLWIADISYCTMFPRWRHRLCYGVHLVPPLKLICFLPFNPPPWYAFGCLRPSHWELLSNSSLLLRKSILFPLCLTASCHFLSPNMCQMKMKGWIRRSIPHPIIFKVLFTLYAIVVLTCSYQCGRNWSGDPSLTPSICISLSQYKQYFSVRE